jgi:uncharacterized protein YqeY
MTLIEQIRTEYLVLRKAHNTAAVASLSTLIGEIENLAKGGKGELTDAVVVTVVKKFIKNIDETLQVVGKGAPTGLTAEYNPLNALNAERRLYEQFLPKQLTETEIAALIDTLVVTHGAKNVGDVMKLLKQNHAGTYDGAVASKILKAKF